MLSGGLRRLSRHQNFSIKFFRTVHILARLPKMYIGMVKRRQPIWMPPILKKTFFEPSDSSQPVKKREKTRP